MISNPARNQANNRMGRVIFAWMVFTALIALFFSVALRISPTALSTKIEPAVDAGKLGYVLYEAPLSKPSSITYANDLATGKVETFIDFMAMSSDYGTTETNLTPSPNGKYLYFEPPTSNCVWNCVTKSLWKPNLPAYDGKERLLSSKILWSPDSEKVIVVLSRDKYIPDLQIDADIHYIYLLNVSEQKTAYLGMSYSNLVDWLGKDSAISVYQDSADKEKTKFTLIRWTLDGKGFIVKSWPAIISRLSGSPDGNKFAVFDGRLTIVDMRNLDSELVDLDFKPGIDDSPLEMDDLVFSRDGSQLAFIACYGSGEPMLNTIYRLGIIDTNYLRAVALDGWVSSLQMTPHCYSVLGWASDNNTLIIQADEMPGLEYTTNDYAKVPPLPSEVYAYKTDAAAANPKLLLSQTGGYIGSYWPGR